LNTQNIEVNIKVNNIEDMYKYAKLQFEAFNKVEKRPSYNDGYIFDIDDPKDQMWFKQFIQIRFCEELAEARAAIGNNQHVVEELTDAFNFLMAAYIMVGKDAKWFKEHTPSWTECYNKAADEWDENRFHEKLIANCNDTCLADIQYEAHWLCNLLKNRPWTQSHFPVSKKEFASRLESLWESWTNYIFEYLQIYPNDIFDYFAKKYCVNMFRIRSGY
jgi:hypothetical protein